MAFEIFGKLVRIIEDDTDNDDCSVCKNCAISIECATNRGVFPENTLPCMNTRGKTNRHFEEVQPLC